jgi:RNA polymerase sigma-B factor
MAEGVRATSAAHSTSAASSTTMEAAALPVEDRRHRTMRALQLARLQPQARQRHLEEAITLNMPVAKSIAHQFYNRGELAEDIDQVALLGLTKAVRRYNPDKGEFLAYAVPTIAGEVKRHFRDVAWTVRPPRRIQELQAEMTPVIQELTQTLGRAPRPSELAERVGSLADVVEALACGGCFIPASLDDRGPERDGYPVADRLGEEDPGYARIEALCALTEACRALKPRDRLILRLRFWDGWSQRQIATELGVTQAQVSRLLRRIMRTLRDELEEPPGVTVP